MTLPLCSYVKRKNRRLKRLKNGGMVWPVCLLCVLVRWKKVWTGEHGCGTIDTSLSTWYNGCALTPPTPNYTEETPSTLSE